MKSAIPVRIVVIIVIIVIICHDSVSRDVCKPNGFYCKGTGKGNLHLKCVTTPCNDTACETIVDYADENGPEVILESNHRLLVNLETENISTIHVLVIDYVRARTNGSLYRLMKPIIVKLQLASPGEVYKLRFVNYVNGGPTEEVISKQTRENYFGCDSGKAHPTCGIQYYGHSDPVPFSEGFCCSCLASVNAARQPRSYVSDDGTAAQLSHNTVRVPPTPDDDRIDLKLRGEPDCTNISTSPSYANPFTYHESSHCFRYSDLWFYVYRVEKSRTFIPITMELFEKNENTVYVLQRSSTSSADGKRMVSKGPVLYRYEVNGLNETVVNDLTTMFILIPQEVPETYRSGLPNVNLNDARKYLVISPSWMSVNGMECDKIGVQPRAFYEQPERCYRPLGSCLGGGRQPVQLLRETSSSGYRERGERLLVEDYVRGTEIRFDGVSKQMVVDGRVSPRHEAETAQDDGVSVRGVSEIVLDDNAVIYDKVLLQLSEIHAISDDEDTALITVRVYVTNLGLTTAEFFVEAFDCKRCRRTAQREFRRPSVVRPQHTAEVNLTITCHARDCNAIVRLYDAAAAAPGNDNSGGSDTSPPGVRASRKFGAVRGSRCYCLWHRRCECHRPAAGPPHAYGDAMSNAEYAAAGFVGDVPPGTAADEMAALNRATVAASLTILAAYVSAALLLGLVKAASPRYRGHWLWMVNSDWLTAMHAYKEPELRPLRMVRDARGYYVHPVTGSRNIRLLDGGQEFVTNLLFFVNLPATLCRHYGMRFDYSATAAMACDGDARSSPPKYDNSDGSSR